MAMLVAAELGQLLAVLRGPFTRDVQQVVAHENARQMDVRPQRAELRLDVAVMRVELIELRVDVLRLARRRQHRHRDQHHQTAEPERRDQPGLESHSEKDPGGLFKA